MSKKGLISLSISVVVILVAAVFIYSHVHHVTPSKKTPATLVTVGPVKFATIPDVATATGTLSANQQTSLKSKIGGYVTDIHFKEGQFVNSGALLVKLEDSAQRQAYYSAKSAASLAKVTLQRYSTLGKQAWASSQDIDQYRSNYEKALATEKADKVALEEMSIKAPINGYLGEKTITKGDYVAAGSDVVSITDTNTLKIEYSLPSRYASSLKDGQTVNLSLSSDPVKTYSAKVSYVAPTVDPQTQTIEVHGLFNNVKQQLKPGESVNISQIVSIHKNAMVVPTDTVITNISGSFVYQVKNNKVVRTPVIAGSHYKSMTVILKGLNKESKIITKGQFQVKSGSIVNITS